MKFQNSSCMEKHTYALWLIGGSHEYNVKLSPLSAPMKLTNCVIDMGIGTSHCQAQPHCSTLTLSASHSNSYRDELISDVKLHSSQTCCIPVDTWTVQPYCIWLIHTGGTYPDSKQVVLALSMPCIYLIIIIYVMYHCELVAEITGKPGCRQ